MEEDNNSQDYPNPINNIFRRSSSYERKELNIFP